MVGFEQFCKDISDEGKRRKLYDAASELYDFGSYESFSKKLGFGSAPAAAPAPASASAPTQADEPYDPVQGAAMLGAAQESINRFGVQGATGMANLNRLADYYTPEAAKRREVLRNTGAAGRHSVMGVAAALPDATAPSGGEGGDEAPKDFRGPVLHEVRRNADGSESPVWMMPDGSLSENRLEAEQAEASARQERMRGNEGFTLGGKLHFERERLAEIRRRKAARQEELRQEETVRSEAKSGLERFAAGLQASESGVQGVGALGAVYTADSEYRALAAAERASEERIGKLTRTNDVERGKDVGFWRGFGDTALDPRSYTGIPGLRDALRGHALKAKVESGAPLSEGEKLMLATEADNAATGDVDNWRYNAGAMTGYMPAFAMDIALMGGTDAPSVLAPRLLAWASKRVPKLVSRKAGRFFTKVIGALPEDIGRSIVGVNTVQAASTASDIVERVTGTVRHDEDGNYSYEGAQGLLEATLQAEGDRTIELYSEMSGKYLDAVGRYFKSKFVTRAIAAADRKGLEGLRKSTGHGCRALVFRVLSVR